MLKYIILGLVCVFILFKFLKKDKTPRMPLEVLDEASKVAIFSEGKTYWGTFEPIVKALLAQNCPVRFYTMDKNDPIFDIQSDILKVDYIGKGDWAFYTLSNLKADILLSTTPNIGTKGYPVRKSPNIKIMIHVWHSFGDYTYAWYHKGSLDSYDEVLTTGEYMEKQIRHIEQIRKLPAKKIVVAGVPYLDKLYNELQLDNSNRNIDKKTVIIAPSWGNKGIFTYYSSDFVRKIHDAGYRVILRPHPQSLKSEAKKFETLKNELKDLENLIWDMGNTSENFLSQADLMISDTSSVRLDFRVLYNKPVITLETPVLNYDEYEYADLAEILKDSNMDVELGAKINKSQIDNIVEIVKQCIEQQCSSDEIKDKYTANFGNAGKYIADYIIERKKELCLK